MKDKLQGFLSMKEEITSGTKAKILFMAKYGNLKSILVKNEESLLHTSIIP